MKTLAKNLILFVSITLSFGLFINAQQIEPPKRNLEFIDSNEYEVLDPSIKEYLGDTRPTHVAILSFSSNSPGGFRMPISNALSTIRINVRPSSGRGNFSLYRCTFKSDDSSELLEFMYFIPSRLNSSTSQTYYILVNNEQQARQFTEALIKNFDIGTYNSLKDLKNELETYREIVRDGQTVISKMEADYNEMQEQKNKLYKEYTKVNYLNEEIIPDINDIVKVKEELAHSLREVDFELVGLDAKIESINKYKLSLKIIDDETLIKLNQILMATDIERAGVLARKQAFETSFKQTTQLYDLILNSKKAFVDLEKYKNKFKYAPETVSNLEMNLKNPRDQYRYIEIEDNKVTIKPVKQD